MAELVSIGIVFLGVLLALYLLGVPVAIAMGLTSVAVMVVHGDGINYELISTQLLYGVNSFPLLAIPFYVLLGRLMNRIGMTDRIFRFANSIVGQFRGGIAYVNIVASMIFSGMSGAAIADAAGLGRIEYKSMRDYGYSKDLAIGVTGSSAIIGPIIPPSIAIIIYGVLAEQSIGQLFLAGIVPGLLMGITLMAFVFLISRRRGHTPDQAFDLAEVWHSLKAAAAALFAPVLIIGGLFSGYFTATEAGAVAVLYAIVIGMFVYDQLSVRDLYAELRDSMIESVALTFIIGVAAVYGLVAVQLRLPVLLADQLTAITTDPTYILVLLVLLFVVVGTFMETVAAISVLVPVVLPVLSIVGIDPIHFGIVMLLALCLGLLTPPLGMILFVLDKVTDATLDEIMRAVIPFYLPIIVVIGLLIFFPSLATYIPYNV